MNTRANWVNSSSPLLYFTKDETISDVQANFDIRRYNSAEGYEVENLTTGLKDWVLIQSHTNPMNENKEDKKVHFPLKFLLDRGSLIKWLDRDEIWMVYSRPDNVGGAYISAQIYKCNFVLKWIENGGLKRCNAIVQDKTLYSSGIDEMKYMIQGDTDVAIFVPKNNDTVKLIRGDRFVIGEDIKFVYKITKLNDYSKSGIIQIFLTEDKITPYDNLELGIANYYGNPTTTLEVENGISIKLKPTETLQLKTSIKQDDKIINLPLVYRSLNESIATVDEVGLITAISNGVTQIKVSLKDNPEISTNVELEVTALPISNNFTIELNGVGDIIKGRTEIYTAGIYNNGIEVLGEQFDFEVVPVDSTPSNSYQLTSATDTTINIKCLSYSTSANPYYIKLIAYKKDEHTIFTEKQIKLKGLI